VSLASTGDFLRVWEQISKLNNLLKEIYGRSFCNTPHLLCSLSGTIGYFLKDIHYYNYTDSIDHAWIYQPYMTKQRSWTMFFFDCQLKLSSIHQTNISSICNENILNWPLTEYLDPPHDLDPPTQSAWIQLNMKMLNAASAFRDAYFTAIQSWCKTFCNGFLFANVTSDARQWPEWNSGD